MSTVTQPRMQFAVGVVTLIAGFALATLIIWFGQFQFLLQGHTTYYFTFANAPGAEVKVPVRRAGIRIGEVRQVDYDDQFSVVVLTVVLEGDSLLREGDIPTLNRSLLGDTYVDIVTKPELRGQPNRRVIEAESTIEGQSPSDPMQALGKASEILPNANEMIVELQKASKQWTEVGERTNRLLRENEIPFNETIDSAIDALDQLGVTLESVNNTLDEKTQENFRVGVQNIRDASTDLKPTIEASRKTLEQMNKTMLRMEEVAANLQTATQPLAERSERTLKNLDEASESIKILSADLTAVVKQIRAQDGTMQRLLNDPSLYQRIDDASLLLVQNLGQVEKILKDFRVFSDKIARHPGELGVQGVFTKDSGLKLSPGAGGARK